MGVNNSSTKQITAHPSLIRPAAGQCDRDAGNAASYNHHSQVRYAITQPLLPSASVWAKGLFPCHLFFSVHCDSADSNASFNTKILHSRYFIASL